MKHKKTRVLAIGFCNLLVISITLALSKFLAFSSTSVIEIVAPITPDIRVIQSEGVNSGQKQGNQNNKTDIKKKNSVNTKLQLTKFTNKDRQVSNTEIVEKKYYILSDPNDTYHSSQWYLQTVKAPEAWNTTIGNSSVKVAVIDSGFALSHSDLTASWQYNSGEMGGGKQADGIDNDGNGYVDDFRGWDFYSSDNNPQAGTVSPSGEGVSHGTEVAGLVGARGNNGIGVTAVSQQVSILPLQVLSDNGTGYSDDIAEAIRYAVNSGVLVINMSLGTDGDDPIVRSAIDYAFKNGVVVVAAAGNCGTSTIGVCANQVAGFITFPASYNRVIAVGATTQNNQRASFSSYGERLDVMAPGSGTIISPTWAQSNGTTAYASSLYGTSYSSPIVASTAALIRSIRPNSSVDDIRALLMANATKSAAMSGSFYTQRYGHGIVDVARAIQVASELNSSGESVPALQQTGDYKSEHSFDVGTTMNSGCEANEGSWCTVWLRSPVTNYERYLPYTKSPGNSMVGWTWNGTELNRGEWEVRARQGSTVSTTPYLLFRK